MGRPFKRRLMAIVALAQIALFGFVLMLIANFGEALIPPSVPHPSAQRIFEASRPGVALVQVDLTLHTTVAEPTLSSAGLSMDASRTPGGVDRAGALDTLLSDPGRYFAPGPSGVKEDFYLRDSGTGFFVSEDGRMVTASHVVARDQADITDEMKQNFDDPTNTTGVANDLFRIVTADVPGFQPGAVAQAALDAWLPGYLKANTAIDSSDKQIAVGYGTATIGDQLMTAGDHAEVVAAEPAYPGKDVAIIKVGVTGATPALEISAESSPADAETADLIGYGPPTTAAGAPVDETRHVRLEAGTAQNYEDHDGFTAYGTDAVARSGDSGGPVLDGEGRVIGMLSYSSTDDQGQVVQGGNYFIPASVIRSVTLMLKLSKPRAGIGITDTYYRGLAAADNGHYSEAVALFASVHARAPADLEARDRLDAAQAAVKAGRDRTPPSIPWSLLGGVVGVIAAALEWMLALLPIRASPPLGTVSAEGLGDGRPGGLVVGDWRRP